MASAQNQGVEATHYSIGISAWDTDHANALEFELGARFPIYGYVGGQIIGNFRNTNATDNGYLDSSSYSGSLSLFLRKHDLGVILASYERMRTEYESAFGDLTLSSDHYSLSGKYYLKDLNFSLGRSKSKSDNSGESYYLSYIGLSYYLNDNLLLGTTASDSDDNGKSVYIMFQPESLNNSIALTASYFDSDTNDSFLISVDYSFDLNVSLKDKARRY
jgi:hypothetical protein